MNPNVTRTFLFQNSKQIKIQYKYQLAFFMVYYKMDLSFANCIPSIAGKNDFYLFKIAK